MSTQDKGIVIEWNTERVREKPAVQQHHGDYECDERGVPGCDPDGHGGDGMAESAFGSGVSQKPSAALYCPSDPRLHPLCQLEGYQKSSG